MTDMSETRSMHSLVTPRQRGPLFVADMLRKFAVVLAHRPASEDIRARADRTLMTRRLQEEARRNVDRLMM